MAFRSVYMRDGEEDVDARRCRIGRAASGRRRDLDIVAVRGIEFIVMPWRNAVE